MTKSKIDKRSVFSIAAENQLIWSFLGGVLLLNAFVSKFLFPETDVHSAISAIAALVFLFPPLLKIVYDDFVKKRVHMNELVLIAVVAGASRGDFMTAGLIAFFMLLGLIIETRSASGAKESLEEITNMTQVKARRIGENGSEETIDPEYLAIGDVLRVRPGEIVPADGELLAGSSSFQESSITGESLPADKSVGDQVFAGTVNLTGAIDLKISKIGSETTLGKVKDLILAAEGTRPDFMRMIDNYSAYYTPLVLILAFFVWIVTDHNMDRVVAVLVAACPIALVLSTPSAAVAALSAGARLGILIKNVKDIEAFSNITAFIFDKTGTLTTGNLSVVQLAPVDDIDSSELLSLAASAEQHSNHPVAKSVCELGKKIKVAFEKAVDLHEEPGFGVRCEINGDNIALGNMAWMKDNGGKEGEFPDFTSEQNSGMSLLFIMKGKKAMGWIALEDKPRIDSASCIEELKKSGVQYISIVTGDRNGVAETIANELGITNFYGECTPAGKIEKVLHIKKAGHKTVFIGDGVNDAPALAASDIGIAMGAAGSDLAVETATIALLNNKLNRLPFLIRLAVSYKLVMYQNFFLGALFILLGTASGAMGYLSGVSTAFLQVSSAVIIVMNSARLIRNGEDLK